ncbi:MAG: hypothetical protein Q9195_003004 [Heterodermia aff. obscurata]
MLASLRHLLRFIDLDETFDKYGFTKKVGAAFKLNPNQREGYTDFLAAGGPEGYAWNVVRSESDDIMLQHARKSGAMVFDGVKVKEIHFLPPSPSNNPSDEDGATIHGRPVSATWSSSRDSTSGTLDFDYVVDASGRAGVLDKYNKNRRYNQGLKNVASWGYWQNTGAYASGTKRANSPFFEALSDESGWAWLIPLHNSTTSVGVVMKQELSNRKKKMLPDGSSPEEFYLASLKLAPSLSRLLDHASLVTDIKHASDYSYNSSSYASPYARVVGDAGCFIDPFFSSGVHLALVAGLSAATTIAASIKGDCSESVAANWHSSKVADGHARFLLVVLSAYKQIHRQDAYTLSDVGEDNIDKAFKFFSPIIQGTVDSTSTVSHDELSQTIDFCAHGFDAVRPEQRAAVLQKLDSALQNGASHENIIQAMRDSLDLEEQRVMDYIRARQILRTEDSMHIDNFTTDVIDGLAPRLERGHLTLERAVPGTTGAKVVMETRQTIG